MHRQVESLATEYKKQFQDREDVILNLTRENDDAMKRLIDLENKIIALDKKNEKTKNDTVNNYETQIKKIDGEAQEKVKDTEVKVTELNENLDKMKDVEKEKLKYELELMAWQQDCASLEKTIQEEKYRIEIEQARMKKEMESQFQDSLE